LGTEEDTTIRHLRVAIEEEILSQLVSEGLQLKVEEAELLAENLAKQIAIRFDLRWKGPHFYPESD
jgi:hypothetical protein